MKYDIDKILKEYNIRKQNANLLVDEVKYIIHKTINKREIKIHHIFDQFKPFDLIFR